MRHVPENNKMVEAKCKKSLIRLQMKRDRKERGECVAENNCTEEAFH